MNTAFGDAESNRALCVFWFRALIAGSLKFPGAAKTSGRIVDRWDPAGADPIGPNSVTPPLNGPKDLCVDPDGAIVIADAENNLVRRFDPKPSTLSTIVGTGQKGDRLVPTDPLATEVFRTHGVRRNTGGDLIITESYNHRVLRLRRQK
jgi:sugar lactone lactonase YvrE